MGLTRHPVARNFYPGDCREQIETFIQDFQPPEGLPEQLTGAILPHAGWVYSGRTAARALFSLARRSRPDTCIMFGADHSGVYQNAIYPTGTWETPLGDLEVDQQLSRELIRLGGTILHQDSSAHSREHSLEVLTPMLRYFWESLKIVPIIVPPGAGSISLGKIVGQLIADSGRSVILVASTDLTHYGYMYGLSPAGNGTAGRRWMRANDRRLLEKLYKVDPEGVLHEARENHNACGPGAVAALLSALREQGVTRGHLIEYTTSHDPRPAAEFDYGVGYAGVVF